jgi:hypothetical protein
MFHAELLEAYQNTVFVVDGPNGEITLRVGRLSQEIDDLLTTHGAKACAFITAWNPRSVRLRSEENSERHTQLIESVHQLGCHAFPGRGIGQNKYWTPEESILVIGIERSLAVDLGRRFGQNAIVFKDITRVIELLFCA